MKSIKKRLPFMISIAILWITYGRLVSRKYAHKVGEKESLSLQEDDYVEDVHEEEQKSSDYQETYEEVHKHSHDTDIEQSGSTYIILNKSKKHHSKPNKQSSENETEDDPNLDEKSKRRRQSQKDKLKNPQKATDGKTFVSKMLLTRQLDYYKNKTLLPYQGLPVDPGNIEFCPFDLSKTYNQDFSEIEPLLGSIRKDKFLINCSPFGPNNQLRGFRDTVLMAIYLNRTIVFPPFFKHSTDPSFSTTAVHWFPGCSF